jgi:hypothetical protein
MKNVVIPSWYNRQGYIQAMARLIKVRYREGGRGVKIRRGKGTFRREDGKLSLAQKRNSPSTPSPATAQERIDTLLAPNLAFTHPPSP